MDIGLAFFIEIVARHLTVISRFRAALLRRVMGGPGVGGGGGSTGDWTGQGDDSHWFGVSLGLHLLVLTRFGNALQTRGAAVLARDVQQFSKAL